MSSEVFAHFIGVGGAGMSGIARVLHDRGVSVTGSDLKESRYSRALEQAGVDVRIGHDAAELGDPQVVVVSTAIPEKNPELAEARRRGLTIWPRARMLAELAGERRTIAVAGTHGKTSTSSMISMMLREMGLSPTFLVGGEVDGLGTNAQHGSGPHYVVEADESDGSFVYLTPHVAVVTNIEADHLDHYGSLAEIEETFTAFMKRTSSEGRLVVCGDDNRAVALAREVGVQVVTYGCSESCDVRFTDIERYGIGSRFRVVFDDSAPVVCTTRMPGVHMVSNACAAIATAFSLGLDVAEAARALGTFTGVRRRFDLVEEIGGITIVDDYAHHPTEVSATLKAARDLGFERVWALFQPHRYSRTQAFATQFGQAFVDADNVVLMDVYTAGEAPIPGVSGKTVLEALLVYDPRAASAYLPHRADVVPYLADRLRAGDLLLTMGAGDVTGIGPELAGALHTRAASS